MSQLHLEPEYNKIGSGKNPKYAPRSEQFCWKEKKNMTTSNIMLKKGKKSYKFKSCSRDSQQKFRNTPS